MPRIEPMAADAVDVDLPLNFGANLSKTCAVSPRPARKTSGRPVPPVEDFKLDAGLDGDKLHGVG